MLVTPAAATHRARGRVIHVAGFSHLLFHYIHRRIAQDKKILNAHNLYNPGSQSSKNNNQHTPYVRLREGYMFGACFSCALVWFEGDLHSLYLHTQINICSYTLIKQFQDTQSLPLFADSRYVTWTTAHCLTVFHKPSMVVQSMDETDLKQSRCFEVSTSASFVYQLN